MKIIFYNLKNFMKRHLLLFLLVITNIFASAMVMSFSYGLYQHYNIKIEGDISTSSSNSNGITIKFNNTDDRYATQKMIDECIRLVTEKASKNLMFYRADGIYNRVKPTTLITIEDSKGNYVGTMDENTMVQYDFHFGFKDGKYFFPEILVDNTGKTLVSGRLFTEEEYASGAKVAVATRDFYESNSQESDGSLVINGEKFEAIGLTAHMMSDLFIPFTSVDENMRVERLRPLYETNVQRSQHMEMKKIFENYFGDLVSFPEGEFSDTDLYYYKTILAIAALIALVAAMNFAVLYRFILMKRQKDLAIYRIVGCTRKKAELFYLGECGIITVPLFALALLAYDKLLLPPLSGIFEYMPDAYSPKIYLYLFAIYMAISAITVWIMMRFSVTNKTILEIRRGAK